MNKPLLVALCMALMACSSNTAQLQHANSQPNAQYKTKIQPYSPKKASFGSAGGALSRAEMKGLAKSYPPGPAPAMGLMADMEAQESPLQPTQQNNPGSDLFYQGWIHSEHKNPDSVLNIAESLTQSLGGLSLSRSSGHLSLQVPPQFFDSLYRSLQRLAPVLGKNRELIYLGDEIVSNRMSLQIAEASLKRLNEILAKAKSDEERIRLLQEIQRVRSQVETLQGKARSLAQMVSMSQLDYNVDTKAEQYNPLPQAQLVSHIWIADLSRGLGLAACDPLSLEAFKFKAPKLHWPQWLRLSPNKSKLHLWASASGSKIEWIRRANNPKGDSKYWQEVLSKNLALNSAQTWSQLGVFQVIEYQKEQEHFLLAFALHGQKMDLILSRLGKEDQVQKLKPEILQSLKEYAF